MLELLLGLRFIADLLSALDGADLVAAVKFAFVRSWLPVALDSGERGGSFSGSMPVCAWLESITVVVGDRLKTTVW